ncbi:MAG: matrixin family metalloprotease [Vulcanibacillus sp.]
MKNLQRKSIIASLLCLIMLFCIVIPTSAYVLMGVKWSSSNITYYYDSYNSSRFKTFIDIGASAWNITDATYSKSASYNIYCSEVDNSTVTWDGYTSGTASGGYFIGLTILINKFYTNTWNSDGALQSVVLHELGHGLGLAGNGFTQTIMNENTWGTYSRYGTYGLSTLQTDDINGANAIY